MQNRISAITRKIEQLPPDLQHEVEDFVEFLRGKRPRKEEKRKSSQILKGIWKGSDVNEEAFNEARQNLFSYEKE